MPRNAALKDDEKFYVILSICFSGSYESESVMKNTIEFYMDCIESAPKKNIKNRKNKILYPKKYVSCVILRSSEVNEIQKEKIEHKMEQLIWGYIQTICNSNQACTDIVYTIKRYLSLPHYDHYQYQFYNHNNTSGPTTPETTDDEVLLTPD